jgi:endonuclease III
LEVARIIKTEGSSENNFPKLLKIILNSKEKIIVVVRTFDRITRQISNYELLKELDEQGKLEIKEVWGIIENKSTAVADFREIFTKTYSQALSKRIRRGIAEKKRKIENYGIQK